MLDLLQWRLLLVSEQDAVMLASPRQRKISHPQIQVSNVEVEQGREATIGVPHVPWGHIPMDDEWRRRIGEQGVEAFVASIGVLEEETRSFRILALVVPKDIASRPAAGAIEQPLIGAAPARSLAERGEGRHVRVQTRQQPSTSSLLGLHAGR